MARQTICLITHCSGMRDIEGDGVCLLPASEMIWTSILTVPPPLSVVPSFTAQSLIKSYTSKKNTGIIGRGYDDGIRGGDVFEVNRKKTNFPRGIICKSPSTSGKASLFSN